MYRKSRGVRRYRSRRRVSRARVKSIRRIRPGRIGYRL